MLDLAIVLMVTLILGLAYASMFEWTLHRYVMHRPVGKFRYPFEAHTLTHHRIFKADQSYHYDGREDIAKIRMAWWNGPVLIAIGTLPFVLGALPFVLLSWWAQTWLILGTGIAVSAGYYAAYEYLHWCMHLPKARRLERSWLFQRINAHHILHHRYMGKNYNVVLPFADCIFGTFMARSKVAFAQVRGPNVPDVQPLPA